ncbi:hypothetical protein WJX72_010899 [[Myrmecia] bisecta]|uniref:Uncharacterized protein n=1 Tax=[Myrmecia] bisecta TaxID=41462 RepID=A0AAW1PA53_9CHLO
MREWLPLEYESWARHGPGHRLGRHSTSARGCRAKLREPTIAANPEDLKYWRGREERLAEKELLLLKQQAPGAPKAGGSWDKKELCDELAAFSRACRDREGATVIRLAHPARWLGLQSIATSELFVRLAYTRLLEARKQYLQKRGFLYSPGVTIFTGTPGVGKSHLGALIVALALIDRHPVLLEFVASSKESDVPVNFYWLHVSGEVEETNSTLDAHERPVHATKAGKNPLYVVDGGVPALDANYWDGETVVLSSPKDTLLHRETKGQRTLTFYVPLWSLLELKACKNGLTAFKGMLDADLEAWFKAAGDVARTCLKRAHLESLNRATWLKDVQLKLEGYKSQELTEGLRRIATSGFPPGADSIFHRNTGAATYPDNTLSPEDPELRQFTRRYLRFASEEIAAMAVVTLHVNKLMDIAMICLESDRATYDSSVGYWLELLAFAQLRAGGLSARPSCPQGPPHPGKSPCLYWQVTKAERHGIVREAVTRMNTATADIAGGRAAQLAALVNQIDWLGAPPRTLNRPVLCFVLPPARFDAQYKAAQRYTAQNGKSVDVIQSEVVHQMVLRLPLDNVLATASDQAARQQFDGAVERFFARHASTEPPEAEAAAAWSWV